MMPITPSGTRTCAMRSPFGRVHSVIVSPTGSGSSATCSTPAAIASTRAGVSVRRSTNAAVSPAAFAFSTSPAFVARSSAARRRSAAAPPRSAAFFAAVDAPARIGAAVRAPRQRATMCSSRLSVWRLTSFMVTPSFVEQHEVVAVNDLVAHFVSQGGLDLARMAAFDLVELTGAIADEAAREFPPVEADALHARADAERTAHLAQPRRQQAPALRRDRAAGAVVDDEGAAGLECIGDPALAAREPIADRQDQRADVARGIEDGAEDTGRRAVGDDGRDTRGRSFLRRGELRRHAAGAERAAGAGHRLD